MTLFFFGRKSQRFIDLNTNTISTFFDYKVLCVFSKRFVHFLDRKHIETFLEKYLSHFSCQRREAKSNRTLKFLALVLGARSANGQGIFFEKTKFKESLSKSLTILIQARFRISFLNLYTVKRSYL